MITRLRECYVTSNARKAVGRSEHIQHSGQQRLNYLDDVRRHHQQLWIMDFASRPWMASQYLRPCLSLQCAFLMR